MARVKAIYKPGDYTGDPSGETAQQLAELFATLFPNRADPEIDKSHAGLAIAALNPRLAQNLARLSAFIAGELPWCQRRDLRELAIQTVNVHFKSNYSFETRLKNAEAAGISRALQHALCAGTAEPLLDPEQRLVVDYARAVVSGEVPADLFSRAVQSFGETGTVELTSVVGFWSFWAMFLNATGPDLSPV